MKANELANVLEETCRRLMLEKLSDEERWFLIQKLIIHTPAACRFLRDIKG